MCPKITIITISFNTERFIEGTILSVIHQQYVNVEYIIIDGGSTDGTSEIVSKYMDKISLYVSEPDNGIYDAMNKGVSYATGEWILFMNAGDSFYSADVIDNVFHEGIDDDIVAVYGKVNMKYEGWDVITMPDTLDRMSVHMPFSHQAVFVRADYHKKYPFSGLYKIAADYDFFYHLYIEGLSFKYVDIVIANYDAIGGLSAKQRIVAQQENAIINGRITSLMWRLYYVIICIKVYVSSLLPRDLYNRIRKCKTCKQAKL
jgi:glycosyltransferase involved in cell wall biosynthesis